MKKLRLREVRYLPQIYQPPRLPGSLPGWGASGGTRKGTYISSPARKGHGLQPGSLPESSMN